MYYLQRRIQLHIPHNISCLFVLKYKEPHDADANADNVREPSEVTGELPGLDWYIRGMYQSKQFPCEDKTGQLYLGIGCLDLQAWNDVFCLIF
jgi:hypothetical protein